MFYTGAVAGGAGEKGESLFKKSHFFTIFYIVGFGKISQNFF